MIPFGVEHHFFQLQLPRQRLSLAEIPNYDGVAPQILFTHLLKAGGMSIIEMINNLMFSSLHGGGGYAKQNFKASLANATQLDDVINEAPTGNAATMHPKYFKIGMVRAPCDYLLSMWAFQSHKYFDDTSTGHGDWPRNCLQKYYDGNASELYAQSERSNTTDDVERFKKWVRAAGGSQMHYLTYRSYVALHSDAKLYKDTPGWDDGQYFACVGEYSDSEQKAIKTKLMATDLSQRYDCLIHTENLEAESRACMTKFAQTIPDQQVRDAFLQKVEDYKFPQVKNNEGKHAQCSAYFDDATTAFVWDREGSFAKKVGYDNCCH